MPWRLLEPHQRTGRRERSRHQRITHTGTGSGERRLDERVRRSRIGRGALYGSEKLQALVRPLVVRPLL